MSQALPKIEAVMKKLVPKAPFNYQFADEDYAAKFAAEVRISRLAGFFAVLAIFISTLGLFGLASFTAEQRAREVGIRKVLGASVLNVWGLLNKEFVGAAHDLPAYRDSHCLLYDEPLAGELPLSDGAVVVDLWLVGSRGAGDHPCNGEFPGC